MMSDFWVGRMQLTLHAACSATAAPTFPHNTFQCCLALSKRDLMNLHIPLLNSYIYKYYLAMYPLSIGMVQLQNIFNVLRN
jgi:hypothetical protein